MWTLLILSILILVFYYKLIKPLSHWKDRGVAHRRPLPIFGNFSSIAFRRKSFFDFTEQLYRDFENERYFGVHMFTKPALYIRDLDLVKKITVKDFDQFTDHNKMIPDGVEPLMEKNLFNLKGQRWRDMRATLSPSFTGSKMKMMFRLLSECAEEVTKYLQKQNESALHVDIKDIFTRFTNDAIASIAFGVECNSLENKSNEFYTMGKRATNIGGFRFFLFSLYQMVPVMAKILRLSFFPSSVSNFFYRLIKETMSRRAKEGFVRPDMIHLLLEARKGNEIQELEDSVDSGFATAKEHKIHYGDKKRSLKLSDEDITAQALIFFFAGFETSSTLMSFMAYELALNSDVQKKLQNEIDETLTNCQGKLTYEALYKMKYMDMVVSETLRKWPPGFHLDRVCVQSYTIDPINLDEKPLTLEKGDMVLIPVVGIHHDPKYYTNPNKFDPERFSDENKHTIQAFSYMPFGSGPRNCIASRFALMENKILMFHLLSKFDVFPIGKTPVPITIAKGTLNFVPDVGFWLGLKQRNPN
ncbi:hypothetical protein FQA39_LY15518 [Lamprigera yunnana]|nr:hypothetical protein FQA39_LY15518 [Lamprigera yunnana]